MRLEYDFTAEQKKKKLDDILWNIVYTEHEFNTNPDSFRTCDYYKEEAAKHAKILLETPWMHTHWLINFVLKHLLNTDLVALIGTVNSRCDPSRWTSNLPQPWGTIAPSLLSLLFFLSSTVVIYFLNEIGISWLAYLRIAYLIWHYFRRFLRDYQLAANRRKLLQVAVDFQTICNEVTGIFQREEVARRLRQLEPSNIYVHSLVYPLLALSGSRG